LADLIQIHPSSNLIRSKVYDLKKYFKLIFYINKLIGRCFRPFLGTKSNTSFDKFSFTVNRNEDTKTKIIQRENSDVGSLSEADQIELALKNSVKDTDEIPVFCDESLKDCTSMNFQNGTTGSPSGGKKVTSLKVIYT